MEEWDKGTVALYPCAPQDLEGTELGLAPVTGPRETAEPEIISLSGTLNLPLAALLAI